MCIWQSTASNLDTCPMQNFSTREHLQVSPSSSSLTRTEVAICSHIARLQHKLISFTIQSSTCLLIAWFYLTSQKSLYILQHILCIFWNTLATSVFSVSSNGNGDTSGLKKIYSITCLLICLLLFCFYMSNALQLYATYTQHPSPKSQMENSHEGRNQF
jgi:hypothetical protein